MKFSKSTAEKTIPARFEAIVSQYPDNIAIKAEHSDFTYGKLNADANQVAREILASGDDSEGTIAIIMGDITNTIIAMIASLKAGKLFVSIDPKNPLDRINDILEDSQANLLLTDNEYDAFCRDILKHQTMQLENKLINMTRLSRTGFQTNLGVKLSPLDYTHLFYTSGSTGKPKGVINNHRIILHSIDNLSKVYKIKPDDKILLLTSPGLSASTSDIFGALLNGASLFPFPFASRSFQDLAQFLIRERITMCHFVPTTFRHFIESLSGSEEFSSLRLIRLGGEAVYKRDVDLYKRHFPNTSILRVGLASTESGSICWNFIDKSTDITGEVVPVGKPIEVVEVFLLNEEHKPVKMGEVGEIAVRSSYLSPGYWRRPDLDKLKFLPDPEAGDRRIYLTGDVGRLLKDGSLLHVARTDSMVKIRGLRIETSEVEAIILGLQTIKEVAVVAFDDRFQEKRLVAYVVPVKGSNPTIPEIQNYVSSKLPTYMVPSFFVFLESLPQLPSGKVDRLGLPAPLDLMAFSEKEFLAPRNELERKLARLFEEFLSIKPVGIRDDFFELGGDSLLVMRIVSEINKTLEKNISVPEFIEVRTVEKIANKIQNYQEDSSFTYLVPLRKTGSNPPLFCVPPSAMTAVQIENLTKYIGEEQPFYGFEYAGMDGISQPFTSIQGIARAFVDDLRKIQPVGPYYLCGLCIGGIVAFEMAQQLVSQGYKVAFLGVLDSNFPPRLKKPLIYYYLITRQYIAKIRGSEFLLPLPEREGVSRNYVENKSLKLRIQRIFTTHHIARMGYTSSPYPGVITRFSTDSPHARRSTRGWSRMTSVGLDLHRIPGGHGAHKAEGQTSFMREPNVQIVAEKLRDSLYKVREESE